MSVFRNYQELQDEIEAWLVHPELNGRIASFIRLAESAATRQLRSRQMVRRARVVANDRYIRIPSDWRKAINIQRVEDNFPLEYLSPAEMDKMRYRYCKHPGVAPLGPTYYSFFGDSMEILPSPTQENPLHVEMLYYAQIRPLTHDSPTNWLLDTHPDIYLYGSLIHSAPFLQEDERLEVWKSLYNQAVSEANIEDMDAKRSGAPMIRPTQTF